MSKIVEWVDHHPYETAGGVFAVGCILVLVLTRRKTPTASQAGSTVAYDAGYNSSLVAAGTQMQALSLAATSHANDVSAALQAHIDDNATATTLGSAKISQGVTLANLAAQTDQSAIAANVTNTASNNDVLNIANNNATTLGLAQTQAATQLGLANIAGQVAGNQLAAGIAAQQIATAYQSNQIAADTTRFQTEQAANVQLGQANIAAMQAQNLANINGNINLAIANTNANVAGMQIVSNDAVHALQYSLGQQSLDVANQTSARDLALVQAGLPTIGQNLKLPNFAGIGS